MKHYIYKTSTASGKFYIGRHSTTTNKPYYGSGKWVRSIKDKSSLTVEILEYAFSFRDLCILEETYISKYINYPLNMNFNNNSVGWATGKLNYAHTNKSKEEKRKLRKGKTYEEIFGEETAKIAKNKLREKMQGKKRNKAWNTGLSKYNNNSLKQMSEAKEGNPAWNKGVSTGIKTFTGKTHSLDSINKMKNIQKENRKNNRVVCTYCLKDLDKANYTRYHGDKCKLNTSVL